MFTCVRIDIEKTLVFDRDMEIGLQNYNHLNAKKSAYPQFSLIMILICTDISIIFTWK